MIFEGPEKKLEIVTRPPCPSLRSLGNDFWKEIVARARAKTISKISTGACDAYLLSESSLFVCDRRMVMITCGRTVLVESAILLLDRLRSDRIASLIYERKNENFPHMQHTTFDEDVVKLRSRSPGKTVVFGDRAGDHIALFHLDKDFSPDPDDATLEVLMYDMAQRSSGLFAGRPSGPEVRKAIGLEEMLPGFAIDDHVFDPVGYSFNAVEGDRYTTLHVTPQRKGSYTSFETNHGLDEATMSRTISRLLEFFDPARADLLVFQRRLALRDFDDRFRVTHRQEMTLGCGYSVEYAHIEREDARKRVASK